MYLGNFDIAGLTSEEVLQARALHGRNLLEGKRKFGVFDALTSLAKEPMVLLLLIASAIYLFSGNVGDSIFLAFAIVLVAVISLYQDRRSQNAMDKLKKLTLPKCMVVRDGEVAEINIEDVVVGDSLMVEEGTTISADGEIVHSNDFSVNESILTGEAFAVSKDATMDNRYIYRGTTVASGLAIATVTSIGNQTELGKIGKSLDDIAVEETPLERQINDFVKKMVFAGAIVFFIVWFLNYYASGDILDSLLKALTLAMSILPEEIPVAFTTFMAMGSYRLLKLGVIVKQIKTVETLGSATVICSDKTGTITENKMTLAKLFAIPSNKIVDTGDTLGLAERDLIRMAMWASEPIPFDPMEISIHDTYMRVAEKDERSDYKMVHEYPLGGKPPMMTHLFEDASGTRIIAAKGAPEAIMAVSSLSDDQQRDLTAAMQRLASDGYRLLGVAEAQFEGTSFPKTQQEFSFDFKGLVAFYDPPKENIKAVFDAFDAAGIQVKIVTGDNTLTTTSIAREIGFKGYENGISGDELMGLDDEALRSQVETTKVFTRMFPAAKLKIISALIANQQIVAMVGDGVNDGPALKAAHIGVAMGKKGTEIAKQAASLILMEDDLKGMVDAVAMGRRIYTNLKKAIQYIISIHIPIILTVFMPLVLGWVYPNIFTPVHVIFLELIMGPTCSIIYENEPMEKDTMLQKPRPSSASFFDGRELSTSIIQGVIIAIGTLGIYQYAVQHGADEAQTRTMVFVTLISANIFLTLVNRSFHYSILTTLKYKNNLVPLIISITVLMTGLLIFVPVLTAFFKFEHLILQEILISMGVGFLSVIWYEGVKWNRRRS